MNAWKAILAAVVIFCAGAVSGGLLVKLYSTPSPPSRHHGKPPGMERGPGWDQKTSFLRKLQTQLDLSEDQSKRIEVILNESQERVKKLWDQVAPTAREEFHRTQDRIRQELTPEQQVKFEALLRERKSRRGDSSKDFKKREDHPWDSSNKTNPPVRTEKP